MATHQMREQLLTMLMFFDDVTKENKRLKEENKILRNANTAYEDLLAGDDGTIDKIKKLEDELQHKSEVCIALQRLADEEHLRFVDIQIKASEQYPKLKNKIEKQQTEILKLYLEKEKLEEALNKVRRDLSPPRVLFQYEVRVKENNCCKYLGDDKSEAIKHYRGLYNNDIEMLGGGIMIYKVEEGEVNYNDWEIYIPL